MAKEAIPEPVLAAADLIHSTAIQLLRYARAKDSEMGLSAARASALSVLVFGGPLRLNELAKAEHVRPPTAAQLVEALVRDGLARKRNDPRDGRAVLIEATAKGKGMLNRGRTARVERVARKLATLAAPQRRLLEKAARLLQARLHEND